MTFTVKDNPSEKGIEIDHHKLADGRYGYPVFFNNLGRQVKGWWVRESENDDTAYIFIDANSKQFDELIMKR